MSARRLGLVAAAVALLTLTMAAARGGWAVFTVEELPDYLHAGEPVDLRFSVRQHGATLTHAIEDVELILSAPGKPGRSLSVKRTGQPGYYTARIVTPEPGEWHVAIQAGGGYLRLDLLPLQAVAAGSNPPARPPAHERGRRLFVAKGCIMCHYHAATGVERKQVGGNATTALEMASDLSDRTFPPQYLSMMLADPTTMPAYETTFWRMPKLNLTADEIADIVAFFAPER